MSEYMYKYRETLPTLPTDGKPCGTIDSTWEGGKTTLPTPSHLAYQEVSRAEI